MDTSGQDNITIQRLTEMETVTTTNDNGSDDSQNDSDTEDEVMWKKRAEAKSQRHAAQCN